MKLRLFMLLVLVLGTSLSLFAQFTPQGFNYQGIVRDDNGNPLANQSVSILFAIRSGAPNGPVVYSEMQSTNTNEYGLVNMVVGLGSPVQGQFNNINWGGASKYLSVALETAPSVFDDLGTTQLLSVPYALYAQSAANGGGGGDDWGAQTVISNNTLEGDGTVGNPMGLASQGATAGQVLKWNGTGWVPSDDLNNGGGGSGTVTQVNTGPGLTGGPITTAGTIMLDNSGVTPGSYGSATQVPVITVDAFGRITGANMVDINGGGSLTVLAGTGIQVDQNGDEFTIINTGDTDASDDLTNISQAGGDVNGPFANLQIKNGVVGTNEIEDGAVGNDDLANDAVTSDKIADGTVGTDDLADDAVNANKIQSGAVGTDEIADGAVGTDDIANDAITSSKIADGTIGLLDLSDMGASNGQILKYDGANWAPADDETGMGGGAVNLSEGTGIEITGANPNFTITNTGDTNAADDLTISSNSGGDLTGPFSNLQLKADVITTLELADAAVLTDNLADGQITNDKIQDATILGNKIAQQGATGGQVLKWNGTTWVPGNDNTGGGGGTISILPGVAIDVIDNGNNNFTISNAGDINPFDDITTSSMAGGDLSGPFTNLQINPFAVTNAELSNNSVFTNNLIDGSVTGDKIAQQGAGIDQVLKWNGTTWAPGSPGDNWGTQNAATNNTIVGNGTGPNPLGIAQQGATNGQVLKWDGNTWSPADDIDTGDDWGTQTANVDATLTGDGAGTALGIAQQGATNGQVLKWDGSTWAPMDDIDTGDDWGTQTANVDATLTGDGAGTALGIAQQGATNGQVLKWDGASWAPMDDIDTGDDWGTQTANVDATLTGDGAGTALGIAQQGATNGQVLKWDGSTWAPMDDIDTGDDWGTQIANVDATLTGDGAGTALGIAQQGATSGQVLKWTGTTWAPADDTDTGDDWGTQTANVDATLTGDGAGTALGIAQQGATNGQVLKWDGASWAPADDTDTGDDWGTQSVLTTGTELTGDGTSGNELALAPQGATAGQVLKWNGTNWIPDMDLGGGTNDIYASGTGINITGSAPNFTINNTGDLDNMNEIQLLGLSGADITLSNGGGMVTLPDASATNELQMLSLSGSDLSISSGNTVDLSGLGGNTYNAGTGIDVTGMAPNFTIVNTGDLSDMNEIQMLSLTGNDLSLSNGGGMVTLPSGNSYAAGAGIDITGMAPNFTIVNTGDADSDPMNEIQDISLSGTDLSITGGSTVDLSGLSGNSYTAGPGISITGMAPNLTINNTGDADADPMNEIQTLGLSGNDLTLSNGGGMITLPDPDPTNELQILSLTGNDLSLSNGGGMVTLPQGNNYSAGAGINITGSAPNFTIENAGDDDADPMNEIQTLSLSGDTLTISGGNSIDVGGFGGNGFWDDSADDIFNNNSGAVIIGSMGAPQGRLHVETPGGPALYLNADSGPAMIAENGNVGVGLLDPATTMHLKGMSEILRVEGDDSRITIVPEGGGPSMGGYVALSDSNFVLGSAGDAYDVEISPNGMASIFANAGTGNVGIVSANAGDAALKVTQNPGGILLENANSGNSWEFRVDGASGSLFMYNDQAGLLPAGIFAPNGIYTPSDKRVKKDVAALGTVKERLLQLEPVTYRYKQEDSSKKRSVGFIAQDVQSLFPEMVMPVTGTDGKEYFSVNYAGIGVIAVGALQEQQAEINELKAENEELRKQFESLDARLKKLEKQ